MEKRESSKKLLYEVECESSCREERIPICWRENREGCHTVPHRRESRYSRGRSVVLLQVPVVVYVGLEGMIGMSYMLV